MALNRPRESNDRHIPSLAHWTRFMITTWVCSCGSPDLESQWSNAAATTPRMSSSTTPFFPDRDENTCCSAYAMTWLRACWWAS